MLADLAARGAVDPGVGHGQLPVEQEAILLLQAGEASPFEGVVLDVVDAFLDLPLVAGCVGPRGPEDQAVVLAKGADLGVELGIEPVGLLHGGLEVIQDQPPWYSAEVAEGTLDAAEEVVGGLAIDGLAVGLAGVGQHDAEDMGFAALAVGADDRGTGAEVDLGLVTGLTLEAAEGKLSSRLQAADEATDAVVAAREAVFGDEILVDALGAEAQIALGLDHVSPGLALAVATVWLAQRVWAEPKRGARCCGSALPRGCRSRGAHWLVLTLTQESRAGGRIGWFWRRAGLLEVARDGLAIDVQLACDLALGPAPAMQRQDDVYHGHFEQIRHGSGSKERGFLEAYLPNLRLLKVAGFQAPIAGWF